MNGALPTPTPGYRATVRYRLGALLGSGGTADVFRADDLLLGVPVAIKIFRHDPLDPGAVARQRDEATVLAGLSHPGLVAVLDAELPADGSPGRLVLELVDGLSLAATLRERAPLAPAELVPVLRQVAAALAYLHGRGIVHRDVKPGNVLLGRDGSAKLSDFGIARWSQRAQRTGTGMTVGTAAYLSPEQVLGKPVSGSSDVYTLGLTALEALTGERAYGGPPIEAALARLQTPPEPPEHLPAPWRALLRAMTALDPAQRPSAAAVVDALDPVTGDVSAPALGQPPLAETPLPEQAAAGLAAAAGRRRSRVGRALVGAAAVSVTALALVAGVGGPPARTPEAAAAVGSPAVDGAAAGTPATVALVGRLAAGAVTPMMPVGRATAAPAPAAAAVTTAAGGRRATTAPRGAPAPRPNARGSSSSSGRAQTPRTVQASPTTAPAPTKTSGPIRTSAPATAAPPAKVPGPAKTAARKAPKPRRSKGPGHRH